MSNHQEVSQKSGKISRSYWIGFILSVVLTLIAFASVYYKIMPVKGLYATVTIAALIQLFVQAKYFLHMNTSTEEGRWDLMTLIFTVFIVAIIVIGTLWIMYNLNYYMVH